MICGFSTPRPPPFLKRCLRRCTLTYRLSAVLQMTARKRSAQLTSGDVRSPAMPWIGIRATTDLTARRKPPSTMSIPSCRSWRKRGGLLFSVVNLADWSLFVFEHSRNSVQNNFDVTNFRQNLDMMNEFRSSDISTPIYLLISIKKPRCSE